MKKQPIILLSFYLLFTISATAQEKLKSPSEFLGYPLGDQFTPHHMVVEYFKYVADNSSGVKIEHYGSTYENRPLLVTFISTPDNLTKLEDIRQTNLRKAGLLEGNSNSEQPAIVWLSYNVHGNESVSTEASMATLYDLANPEDKEKQAWLDNTVVVIDPCLNPDGRERYVNWYKQVANQIPNPEIDSREHHEPWPGGRANHYLFDLNRDWAWQTQAESRARVTLYNQWLPHVHVDFHEQGYNEPYYFAPAAEPFHELITNWQREFQTTIGKNHARYFDKNNWLYFTKEKFDLFYPSYGDTYPIFNGAIGMTYEQGGSGRAGLAIITVDGDTLTLKDRIEHHHTTGLSTVEVTSENADKVVQEFAIFFQKAINEPTGKYNTFIVKSDQGKDKLEDLKAFLDRQQVSYGFSKDNGNYKGYDYQTGKESSFKTTDDDMVISAYQPKATLVQVLFEPQSKLSDSVTYDITAWAIPYMFGVKAYALTEKVDPVARNVETASAPFAPKNKPYAYLSNWESLHDVKWLGQLLKAGVNVRFAEEAFDMDNQSYPPGSLIVTRTGNHHMGDRFDSVVLNTAKQLTREIIPAYSGFVQNGKDFGSESVKYLNEPRVAVLSGNEVSSLAFGEVWHFFEQQIGFQVAVLDTEYLEEVVLSDYDVLIVPDGDYKEFIDKELAANFASWVHGGGKLILMEDAIAAVIDKEDFNIKKYASEEEKTKEEEAKKEPPMKERLRLYKDRKREALSDITSGSIYKLLLDNSHPLGFGYPDYYFTLKNNNDHYVYLADGWNVGVIEDSTSLKSGFSGYKLQKKLEESLVFGVQELGDGHIVYMVDNPLFRAFWYNGKLLFSNAVFMVGQ